MVVSRKQTMSNLLTPSWQPPEETRRPPSGSLVQCTNKVRLSWGTYIGTYVHQREMSTKFRVSTFVNMEINLLKLKAPLGEEGPGCPASHSMFYLFLYYFKRLLCYNFYSGYVPTWLRIQIERKLAQWVIVCLGQFCMKIREVCSPHFWATFISC
jgi:hypothetical protein